MERAAAAKEMDLMERAMAKEDGGQAAAKPRPSWRVRPFEVDARWVWVKIEPGIGP